MNKKKMFTGWTGVYGFTVKQTINTRSFKVITTVIALIALVSLSAINIIVALVNNNDKDAELTMKKVVVCDDTKLLNDNFINLDTMYQDDLKNIEVVTEKGSVDEICRKYLEDEYTVIIHTYQTKEDDKEIYKIEMKIPENSRVSIESGDKFMDMFETYFNSMKLVNSGIESQKLMTILTPAVSSASLIGEEADTMGEEFVKYAVPMIFALLFYMMLLMYGQSICKCVIAEKISKLMETMLTTVKPYAVITGKVLGMASVAISQLVLWVVMGVAGFVIGDKIAANLTPGYKNIVMEVINLVREDAGNAFKPEALILFVLAMCIGFVMYCIFAALASSGAKRAEELNSSLAVYNIIVVIGFLVSYMVPISDNGYEGYINYVPPVAAFKLPTDILTGKISYDDSVIPIMLMIVTIFVLIILTGKIYKKKVF